MYLDNIAYSGKTPWHGSGVSVDKGSTPLQMAEKADLLRRVRRHGVSMRDAVTGVHMPVTINGKKQFAIVREGNTHAYQIASENYRPIQDVDSIGMFAEDCELGNLTMETVGSFGKGEIVWGLARINGLQDAVISGDDPMRALIMIANSHSSRFRYFGKLTEVCIVCWNTFQAARKDGGKMLFQYRNTGNLARLEQVRKQALEDIHLAATAHKRTVETAQYLADTPAPREMVEQYVYQLTTGEKLLDVIARTQDAPKGGSLLDQIAETSVQAFTRIDTRKQEALEHNKMGQAVLAALTDSPGHALKARQGTWWGAFNAVTYVNDHITVRGKDEDGARLESAWLGKRGDDKAKALELAVEYAMKGQSV